MSSNTVGQRKSKRKSGDGSGCPDRPKRVSKTRQKTSTNGIKRSKKKSNVEISNIGDCQDNDMPQRKSSRKVSNISRSKAKRIKGSGFGRESVGPVRSSKTNRKSSKSSEENCFSTSGKAPCQRHVLRPDTVVPLQETIVPAKNKDWGCLYCKFYQYNPGVDLSDWNGRKTEIEFTQFSPQMNGDGPLDAEVMFVTDGPNRDDDVEGKPFSAVYGKLLNTWLKYAQLIRSEVYITHAVKCRIPENSKSLTYPDSVSCSCFLSEEVRSIKPKIIVALGKVALQALLGNRSAKITEAHGNPINVIIAGHSCILFPMWHPSYVLRNDHLTSTYVKTFKKLGSLISGSLNIESDDAEYRILKDPNECMEVVSKIIKDNKITAFDFETSGLDAYQSDQRLACLSLSNDDKVGYCIPLYITKDQVMMEEIFDLGWSKEDLKNVIKVVKSFFKSDVPKIGHNVKFDMHWAQAILNVLPNNVILDTMLMHFAIDETSAHGLKPLALKYTNMGAYDDKLDLEAKKYKKRYDLVPLDILGIYAAMDAVATIRVYDALAIALDTDENISSIENLSAAFLPEAMLTLQEMENRGAHIDLEFSKELHEKTADEIIVLSDAFQSHPKVRKFIRNQRAENDKFVFSANSPKQMSTLFFGGRFLNYPILEHKLTPTGNPSTDKEVMQHLINSYDCKIARYKQDLGLLTKLQSTYIEKIMLKASACIEEGILHGSFNVHGTVTGRLCVDGNMVLDTSAYSVKIKDLDLNKYPECTILTHKGRKRKILNKYYKGREDMYEVKTDDGKRITCTKGHRFLRGGKWDHLRNIKEGDKVLTVRDKTAHSDGFRNVELFSNYVRKRLQKVPEISRYCSGIGLRIRGLTLTVVPYFKRLWKEIRGSVKNTFESKLRKSIYREPRWFQTKTFSSVRSGCIGNSCSRLFRFIRDLRQNEYVSVQGAEQYTLPQISLPEVRQEKESTIKPKGLSCSAFYERRGGGGRAELCTESSKFIESTIISIIPVGVRDVWDLEVEEDHSYVANGFVNHNSSSNPNLQNIPNKGAAVVKRMFTSRYGLSGCLVQADYSQIELRILASLSRDKRMCNIYKDSKDIHKMTTLRLFNLKESVYDKMEKTDSHEHKRMRVIAKRINFGISYGIGALGIVNLLRSEGVLISKQEANDYIDKYFETYPRVRTWIDSVKVSLKKHQVLISNYGRRRHLPEVCSDDEETVARAYRQGPNFVIQSAASDTTLTSLILINDRLKEMGLESSPVLTVHDSIILDCLRSEAEVVIKNLKDIMENIPKYGPNIWGPGVDFKFLKVVPICADIEIGVNWRDLVKVNNTVSESLLNSELKEAGVNE